MSTSTQPGGASTAAGVLYQVLWCLLRVLRLRLHTTDACGESAEAVVVLEPAGGGGDLQVASSDITSVEQLKAKSDGGTWSLQKIIAEVLPDLLLATADVSGPRRYRFITEGTIGRWSDVYHFFRRLMNVEPPSNILDGLDDTRPLQFQTSRSKPIKRAAPAPFFQEDRYTERSLFLFIARSLRTRAAIAELQLTDDQLFRRLWRLLGAFEFMGDCDRQTMESEIDRMLLAVVDRREEIPSVRARLAQSLLKKIGVGHVELTADALLKENNLNATPLLQWSRIRARSKEELCNRVKSCGYWPELDVRADAMKPLAQAWRDAARPIIIAAGSGQGKTWSLAALALEAAADDAPVLWIEATGDAAEDLQNAADQFWLDIRGGESTLPLRQIASRLNEVVPSRQQIRLRLCIDNVTDYGEAESFLREEWASRGLAIALSCTDGIAESLRGRFKERVDVVSSGDFSWEELHELLERRLATAWTAIPHDVREVLCRPLLASIYCEEVFDAQWAPVNEYQLFERVWQRLSTGRQTRAPMDVAFMTSLAEAVLRGDPYPWTFTQLHKHGIDNDSLSRLERCGWLMRTEHGARVTHDRLLNWAVAEALCSSLRSGARTHEAVVNQITQISKGDSRVGNVYLGYVPMDALWLLSEKEELPLDVGARLLEQLESNFGRQPERLYDLQVGTLGSQTAPILFERYRTFKGVPWLQKAIGRALINAAGDRLAEYAEVLLTDPNPATQRAGLKLVRDTACPRLLARLWELHCQGLKDPKPFLDANEQRWLFREDSWPALRNTAICDPDWIAQRIHIADAAADPVDDLAWLVANLPNGTDVWRNTKHELFRKIPANKTGVLARCAGLFRDRDCLQWLRSQIANGPPNCSPVALRALARIEPAEAISALRNANLRELQLTTSWAFRDVWHLCPADTNAEVLRLAQQADDPWQWGFLYKHRPQDAPIDLVALLLDSLDRRLEQQLANGLGNGFALYSELTFVAQATAPEQLDLLETKRGTCFESRLAEYVRRQGPQRGQWYTGHERALALTLLHRINGGGFTGVINDFLGCDDRFGRHEALEWAMRCPDEVTFRAARRIVASDELWGGPPDGFPVEQNQAMDLLAAYGDWEGVADGLQRWGLQTHIDLTEDRLAPSDYAGPYVDRLRQEVTAEATPPRILALGFMGGRKDAPVVQGLLHDADPRCEQAHACIIALRLLGDTSARGVALVSRQLEVQAHRHSALQMLMSVGTPEAWTALMSDLHSNFDHITALNLINLSQHAEEAARLALQRIPTQREFGDWGLLPLFVRHLRPEYQKQIVADPWLRNKFHREAVASEGSGWLVGSKAAAIECLGEFDAAAAYDAAVHALSTPKGHDRERYPYILNEIDAERSLPAILKQLETEQDFRVRYAIGRVLGDYELKALLQTRFQTNEPATLACSCFAASWAKDGTLLLNELQQCLANDDEAVVRAAMDALDRIRDKFFGSELLLRAERAEKLSCRMAYADAAIEIVDPGDEFRPWPSALSAACEAMPTMLRKEVSKRLKARRKKLTADLKEKSRKQ